MTIKRKIQPHVDNIGEATTACLITMVQGNLLVITAGHWLVAAKTGLIAGSITALALTIWKTGKLWIIALVLGLVRFTSAHSRRLPGATSPKSVPPASANSGISARSELRGV